MRVRWTTTAANDLSRIVEYIRQDNPAAARRVAQVIYQGVSGLRKFPNQGRIGLANDTLELIFAPLPHIAVYEILNDQVQGSASVMLPRTGRKVRPHHRKAV